MQLKFLGVMICIMRPPGGPGRTPENAYLGQFGGLPRTPLKTPEPPYHLKGLWVDAPQTYNKLKSIVLVEVRFLEMGCPFRPILPWAGGKSF